MNIRIRPVAADDAGAMIEALHESMDEVSRWMSWCYPEYDDRDARVFIEFARDGWANESHFEWVIEETGSERFLGCVGVNGFRMADRFANLGYWVRTSATGQGVATRAVELAMDHAWERTAMNRLEIVVAADNGASRRVAEKSGAIFEGVLRHRLCVHGVPQDAAMYALLRVVHHIR